MNSPGTSPEEKEPARISKNVFRLMAAIVVGLALVALYANVQRLRRARIETVTFTPAAATATATAAATPSPSATPP